MSGTLINNYLLTYVREKNNFNYVLQRSPRSKAFVTHVDRMSMYEGDPPTCWRHLDLLIEEATELAESTPGSAHIRADTEPPTSTPMEPIGARDLFSVDETAVKHRPIHSDVLGLQAGDSGETESPFTSPSPPQVRTSVTPRPSPLDDQPTVALSHAAEREGDRSPSLHSRPKRNL